MSMSSKRRQLHLGLFLFGTGYHPAGWRLPEGKTDGAYDPQFLKEVAQKLEKAKFDFFSWGTDWPRARICSIYSLPK